MQCHVLLIAATLLVRITATAAPQKPDFTGDWVLNRQASTLSPAMAGVGSGSLHIDQHEGNVRVRLTLIADGKPFETGYDRPADGREVTDTQQGRTTVSSLRLNATALVFTAVSKSSASEGSISVRYELEEGGRRLRAVEQIRGAGRDQDNVWMFDRR